MRIHLPPTTPDAQEQNGNGFAKLEAPSSPFLEGVRHKGLRSVLAAVEARDPHQPEFLAAVKEVALSLQPVFEKKPELLQVFQMMCEPERQVGGWS